MVTRKWELKEPDIQDSTLTLERICTKGCRSAFFLPGIPGFTSSLRLSNNALRKDRHGFNNEMVFLNQRTMQILMQGEVDYAKAKGADG